MSKYDTKFASNRDEIKHLKSQNQLLDLQLSIAGVEDEEFKLKTEFIDYAEEAN